MGLPDLRTGAKATTLTEGALGGAPTQGPGTYVAEPLSFCLSEEKVSSGEQEAGDGTVSLAELQLEAGAVGCPW